MRHGACRPINRTINRSCGRASLPGNVLSRRERMISSRLCSCFDLLTSPADNVGNIGRMLLQSTSVCVQHRTAADNVVVIALMCVFTKNCVHPTSRKIIRQRLHKQLPKERERRRTFLL
ncbi:hypothetical protein LSAT2_031910 [Lamellibrachia satsuma]|nr:hypothetical protein LSAT2_031910 [Lamellibrachia satsuma]